MIGYILSFLSVLVAFAALLLSNKKEKKTDTREEIKRQLQEQEQFIKINLKLDEICRTTSDTRNDIKGMKQEIQDLQKFKAETDLQLKTIWKRLDEMKGEFQHG